MLLVGGYVALCLYLDTPRGQHHLADVLSARLSEHLGARVEIGAARLGLPGHVRLSDVALYDRADTLMLHAAVVNGTIALGDLLNTGAVRLRSVALLDGAARLYQQHADTAANYQFLLDAFKGKAEPSRPTDVRISQLVVRRFDVCYDRYDLPAATSGVFNTSHINVRNLSLAASLPTLTDSLLHVQVRELSFEERSGLLVNNLRTEMWLYKGGLKLQDLDLRLPHSHVALPVLTLAFQPSDFLGTLRTGGTLADAVVNSNDLAPLVPSLSPLHTTLHVSTAFDISPSRLTLRQADVSADNPVATFRGDIQIDRNAAGINHVVVHSERLATNVASVSQAIQAIGNAPLPDMLNRLGGINYEGTLAWQRGADALFNGILTTAQGTLSGEARYTPQQAKARIYLSNVQLASLLQQANLPASLTATIDGTIGMHDSQPQAFDGAIHLIQALYKGRLINDIKASGHADRTHVALNLASTESTAALNGRLTCAFSNGTPTHIDWIGNIQRFVPAAWGIDSPAELTISLNGAVQADGLAQLATLNGQATLTNVSVTGGGMDLHQEDIALNIQQSGQGHDVDLHTPYGDITLNGPLNIARLKQAAIGTLQRALPQIAQRFITSEDETPVGADASWDIYANISNDKLFSELLHLPISAPAGISLDGHLAESGGRTEITLSADTISYDNQGFSHVNAFLQGEGEEFSLLLHTQKELAGMQMELAASAQTLEGKIGTTLSWRDAYGNFRGELSAETRALNEHSVRMLTELQPTEVYFKDSVWNVVGGNVIWGGDTLVVNRLLVEHERGHIAADGTFSAGSPDSISADLRGVDLEYIFDLLKFHPVNFAGIADGHTVLTFVDNRPVVRARLNISNFSINNGPLGQADIGGEIDLKEMTVALNADILDMPHGRTLVAGIILPKEGRLDLDINSRRTNLEFLRPYIGGILHNISGRATGHTRLYGPFKELQLAGDVVADISGGLPVLGTTYNVDSTHVKMTPGHINILSGRVRDKEGGTAQASGSVNHHFLGNFRYEFHFDLNHCLIYDRQRTSDLTFSSHALASGHVGITGEPGRLDCNIDVRPEAGSDFIYHVDLPEDYTTSTLLHIRPAPTLGSGKSLTDELNKNRHESSSDVYMNLNLEMHPDVPLTVVMDEKTGDNIVVRGSGPLRATYYNKGQFNLFGTYTVASGIYKMTIQDIIHKDFHFQDGGTVVFNGKPFDGLMDMQAIYTVPSASLADLNLTSGVSQNGVRVNCLLNFSGQLNDPKVAFDLDMPTVSQDVKQMVRSLISTDEEMNRQVLYLLAIGRFYTYDYASTDNTHSIGENAMNSFLSNTLSGQLNNFIASAIGQSNWTFGTNVSTGSYGWEDVGVEGQIGGRLLNNRLLINGNFGYRNSVTGQNSNFVGDFDVQYLLTPGGGVRLKAYNETNDRYFTKNSLTTQGIGIIVGRNFNGLNELFGKKKKSQTQ